MADTSIAVTAGAGTAVDTRTEATNGNHRQVVVIGDPSVNAGVCPVDVTNGITVQGSATGTAIPTTQLDSRPASSTITVVDTGTSTTTGQNSANIITGTPTASSFQTQAINGYSSCSILVTGTWTGTLTFEVSADGGTTYSNRGFNVSGAIFRVGSITGNGMFVGEVSACTHVRVRATAAMTGTATVQMCFGQELATVKINSSVSLYDNTSGSAMTIKAASTAAQATDTAVVVSISPNTNSVIISSSALPTGASTSAKQPALGTAGTSSIDCITIQGIASMTPLQVVGTTADDAVATNNTVRIAAIGRNAATYAPTYTAADHTDLATDITTGRLLTNTAQHRATTSTLANVTSNASSVTLQALNTGRLAWYCFNDATTTLSIKFGATASSTSFTVQVPAGGFYELPYRYTGIIDGIWAGTPTGSARVTELTA